MRAGGIWLFGEPEEENEMESKENVLERFMRDQEHKANSLYNSGFRAGYEAGHNVGYVEGFNKGYDKATEDAKPEEDIIKVGDEIEDGNGLIGIVTNTDTHYHIFYPHNGKTWKASKDMHFKKTGRTYNCKEFFYGWSPF